MTIALRRSVMTETVDVTSAPEGLDISETSASTIVDTERIEELPVRSRNYLEFVLLAHGVVSTRTAGGTQAALPDSGFSFAGLRPRSNTLTIDGLENDDELTGSSRTEMSLEAVIYTAERGNWRPSSLQIGDRRGARAWSRAERLGELRLRAGQKSSTDGEREPAATGNSHGCQRRRPWSASADAATDRPPRLRSRSGRSAVRRKPPGGANSLVDLQRGYSFPVVARPLGLRRNSLRTPVTATLNVRVVKYFPMQRHSKLDLVIGAFNLLNRKNVTDLNAVWGSSFAPSASFGDPIEASAARQIEFSVDFEF